MIDGINDAITLSSLSIRNFWRKWRWHRVDMSHHAFMPIGFSLVEYCEQKLKRDEWVHYGAVFYFKRSEDAIIFALRWI